MPLAPTTQHDELNTIALVGAQIKQGTEFMNERNAKQGYSAYLKAAYATVFTLGSFMLAKSSGYLFGSSDLGEENKSDKNIEINAQRIKIK